MTTQKSEIIRHIVLNHMIVVTTLKILYNEYRRVPYCIILYTIISNRR